MVLRALRRCGPAAGIPLAEEAGRPLARFLKVNLASIP
jgi:hypothetical protein